MIKRLYIDLETTGTDCYSNGIHQISGIIEIDGIIKEKFDFKVRPFEGCVIVDEALEKGNVTLEQIMQYTPEKEVFNFLTIILSKYVNKFNPKDKLTFVGYNANFDNDFLRQFWLRNRDEFYNSIFWGNILDVMVVATEFFEEFRQEFENFKLMTIAQALLILIDESKLHNAMYDIEITREILLELVKQRKENILRELEKEYLVEVKEPEIEDEKENIEEENFIEKEIRNLPPKEIIFTQNPNERTTTVYSWNFIIWFGKYAGSPIKDIIEMDPIYIIYLHNNKIRRLQFSERLLEEVKFSIEKKKIDYIHEHKDDV